MADVLSESITVRVAPHAVLGVAPTAGWTQLQIDKATLQNWGRTLQTVERNIHSKYMVPRKGDVVGWSVSPQFAHDVNKDFMDVVAEPAMRCVGQHPGGNDQRVYRPTAVTASGFTVAANGDLPNGTLVKTRGFTTDANNAVFVTATAVALEIATTPAPTIEAAPPQNATLDVIGFVGATGDIEIDANGDIISTAENFLARDIHVGSLLKVGGDSAGTRFASAYNGWAWVKSVSANLIELEDRTWTPGAADAGAGKTIQIFTSSLYRNYAIDDARYAKKLLYGELEEPLAGTDGTTRWTTCEGLAVNTLELGAPLKSKITATISMVGTDASLPFALADRLPDGAGRGTGPGTAFEPLVTALADTANDEEFVRVMDASSNLIAEINSFTIAFGNNVTPKEVQGTPGAVGHHFGEFMHRLTVEAYYTDSDQSAAASDNRDLRADCCINNNDFAFAWRLPLIAMREANKTYAANTQVTMNFETPAFGHETTNVAGVLCIFGHVPDDSAL